MFTVRSHMQHALSAVECNERTCSNSYSALVAESNGSACYILYFIAAGTSHCSALKRFWTRLTDARFPLCTRTLGALRSDSNITYHLVLRHVNEAARFNAAAVALT
jgi:hypothetical protein